MGYTFRRALHIWLPCRTRTPVGPGSSNTDSQPSAGLAFLARFLVLFHVFIILVAESNKSNRFLLGANAGARLINGHGRLDCPTPLLAQEPDTAGRS
jgi:hypothetical protein